MANTLYPLFKQKLASPGVDLVNKKIGPGAGTITVAGTLSAVLLEGYTYSAAHEFYSSASASAVGAPVPLASVTVNLGVVDAADVTFTAVPTGHTLTSVGLFINTGTAATSPLVANIGTVAGPVALSIVSNGGDVAIAWDNGASKIFAI